MSQTSCFHGWGEVLTPLFQKKRVLNDDIVSFTSKPPFHIQKGCDGKYGWIILNYKTVISKTWLFIAGPVLGSHFLEEDIEMQEFASCSFGQLSKLPVGVPQTNIQKIQRKLVLNRDRAVQTSEAAKL